MKCNCWLRVFVVKSWMLCLGGTAFLPHHSAGFQSTGRFSVLPLSFRILHESNSIAYVANGCGVVVRLSRERDERKASSLGSQTSSSAGWIRRTFPTLPWSRLPNILVYMRLVATLVLPAIFYIPSKHKESALVFVLAAITDYLDGYLARRWDATTDFGAFLDPVADKIMVSTALILLSGRYGPIVALPTTMILAREIAVSALREWMAQKGQRDMVKVGSQGKVKTALTMMSLSLLLLVPVRGQGWLYILYSPAVVLLYLCTVLTWTSGFIYFKAAHTVLTRHG